MFQSSTTVLSAQTATPTSPSESYGACVIVHGKASGTAINRRFAMHSTMKFPQALFVAECLNARAIDLHEKVTVRKNELMQNTWSPMLKMFSDEREFTYAELLELSLMQSDNNACDILFRCFGGPQQVQQYIHQLGFTDIYIRWTEQEMAACSERSADNCCTPLALARLFEWFFAHKQHTNCLRFVWQTMASCQTGAERIASVIPPGAVFVHKTGTGFPSADNRADRIDAGIIVLPDGSHQAIAVFAPLCTDDAFVASVAKQIIKDRLNQ